MNILNVKVYLFMSKMVLQMLNTDQNIKTVLFKA